MAAKPPRGPTPARQDAPRLTARTPPARPQRATGLALPRGRAHGGGRPARRGRRAGTDLPRPGRPARRRSRQHLLVRLQQGRAARPGHRPRARAESSPPIRGGTSRGPIEDPSTTCAPSRSPCSTPSSSAPGSAPTSCATPTCSPTPSGSTSAWDSRSCDSTSPPARRSTRSRRSSASSSAPRPTWARSPRSGHAGRCGREEYLARYADRWRALDPSEFPFVHRIVDEFAGHDDADQFRAGLDLLLAGLRLQAES